jgi:glutaredoxin 3
VLLSAGFILTRAGGSPTPPPGEETAASPSSETGSVEVAPAAGRRVLVARGPEEPAQTTYYQWVDERGAVRFARSLAEVPPAWRDKVGRIGGVDSALIRTSAPKQRPRVQRPEDPARPVSHDVTIYTAPWCGWCRKTIAFLDERDIEYTNKDIEADREYRDELIEKTGGTSIPYVEIDGESIRGYNAQRMTALLR